MVVICTLRDAHWQHLKLHSVQPCSALNWFGKIEINAPINIIIIIIIIIHFSLLGLEYIGPVVVGVSVFLFCFWFFDEWWWWWCGGEEGGLWRLN